MPAKEDLTAPLLPGRYYHIFNRGNNKIPIFYSEDNFRFFLHRYFQYVADYWDTFGYCLIENHFHILVGVKDEISLEKVALRDFKKVNLNFRKHHIWPKVIDGNSEMEESQKMALLEITDLTDLKDLLDLVNEKNLTQLKTEIFSWVVSERFRKFLLSYAKALNKKCERSGSLFQKAFRRKELCTLEDRKLVLAYIHHNPIHHGYTKDAEEYPWTSLHHYSFSFDDTQINYQDGIKWFGGKEAFNNFFVMYQHWRKNISNDSPNEYHEINIMKPYSQFY